MKKHNIFDIDGMELPAGRRTRVMIGSNGVIQGKHFCQGYVVIYPGGSIPLHEHETIETYTVLKGEGEMTVDGETLTVKEGDFVYVDENKPHALMNTGTQDLHMMFVYAPNVVVSHWQEELDGSLK